ncbi:MAG: hypothetical protein P4L69_20835, partial [Desulfosporosinus sp.]|nr:hypothetical protein [Desulfosporosinus sp.]
MAVYYQSLLGLSTINGDDLNVDNLNCKHFAFSDGSEADGYILTSDSEGNGTWKPDPNTTLAGDVSGALLSNVVNSVGGSSSANIQSSELLANASTSSNIPSAIVRRDASGGFSAGSISANLVGNASSATLVTLSGDCVGASSGNQVSSLRGGTVSIPTGTDTLVNLSGTQTLTNKTLTAPKMSTIVNTGTLTLPASTDTLVGRATTDTLTNKTITGTTNTVEANSMRNGSTWVV